MTIDAVTGRRILVVEDETLVAIEIEDALHALGCEIVGPTGELSKALDLATYESFDAAILDVTIRGGKVYPLAEQLLASGVPFVLASGYGDWILPKSLRNQPRLTKPFTQAQLEEQIRLLCAKAAQRHQPATDQSASEGLL